MRGFDFTSLTSAAALAELAILSFSTPVSAVIGFDVAKSRRALNPSNLRKRATKTLTSTLTNDLTDGVYYLNVSVGTPAQTFSVQLDTGSSDVWVPAANASFCTQQTGDCPFGTFDPSKSSTFKVVETDGFNITYADGTGAAGDYFTDTFKIGSDTVQSLQMGIAYDTTIGIGLMGVAHDNGEANTETGNGSVYPSVIDQFVSQGLINVKAYSLWLNDLDSSSGQGLFGGVDTDKYSGSLVSLPIQADEYTGAVDDFTVVLSSVGASNGQGSNTTISSSTVPVVLDSGTDLTYLPTEIAEQMMELAGAATSRSFGGAVVPCSLADESGSFTFGFGGSGGPVISVPLSEFALPVGTDSQGQVPTFSNGDEVCLFGIQPQDGGPYIMGDTFLRSAYVVYDMTNNQIAIAQTVFNVSASNVQEIPSGSSIPGVSSTATAAGTAAQTATGFPLGFGRESTATGVASATDASTVSNTTAFSFGAATGTAGSSTSTSTSTHKSMAGTLPPFERSTAVVVAMSFAFVLLGGGFFAMI